MTKRRKPDDKLRREKSGEHKQPQVTSSAPTQLKQRQIDAIVKNGILVLHRSLKAARGFERQKLGRRQKKAESSENASAEVERILKEIAALKETDLYRIARLHLCKTIIKTPFAKTWPELCVGLQSDIKTSRLIQSQASDNVQARLFNTAVVRGVVDDILKQIRQTFGLSTDQTGPKKRLRAKDFVSDPVSNQSKHEESTLKRDTVDGEKSGSHGLKSGPEDRDRKNASKMGSESSLSDDDIGLEAAFTGRLADSDQDESSNSSVDQCREDDEWSGSEDEEQDDPDATLDSTEDERVHRVEYSLSSVDPIPKSISSGKDNHNIRKSDPAKSKKPVQSTIYLPSLAQGYISGSDEASGLDDEDSDSATTRSRKNRRGQRARRKIAELKYKENANHLKKQKLAPNANRDDGWDARRGASQSSMSYKYSGLNGSTPRSSRPPHTHLAGQSRHSKSRATDRSASTGANTAPVLPRTSRLRAHAPRQASDSKTGSGTIHPSWEAAKKMKESRMTVAYQGKKVTF